ncbi:MAG: hypothetical protein JSS49_00110 [Planctomycetes bacterium]|nr:hypothetical protein [Planctomycetota bacterium]
MTNSSKQLPTEWPQAPNKARERGGSAFEILHHAATACGTFAIQMEQEMRSMADEVAGHAGVVLQNLASSLSQDPPYSSVLERVTQSVARRTAQAGAYLERVRMTGLAKETTRLVRRHPVSTILIVIGLIWFLGFHRRN